jgi:hypothetical protein
MLPRFGIFSMNNTSANMVVVRNRDVGDLAPVLVFFTYFLFTANGNSVFEEAGFRV